MDLSASLPDPLTANHSDNRTARWANKSLSALAGGIVRGGGSSLNTNAQRHMGTRITSDPADGADTILLTLPAHSSYLAILRTATAGLAARLRFTLDEIEDMRIAVDEACAMLLAEHLELPTQAELTCTFLLFTDEIHVRLTTSEKLELPPQNTFAWQVLTALADEVQATVAEGRTQLYLRKRRSGAS